MFLYRILVSCQIRFHSYDIMAGTLQPERKRKAIKWIFLQDFKSIMFAKKLHYKMKKNITLTQKEFVRRITGTAGMTYDEAERIVQIVVKEMASCLLDGIGIKFRGVGDIYGEIESGTGIYESYYESCSHKFTKGSGKIQVK